MEQPGLTEMIAWVLPSSSGNLHSFEKIQGVLPSEISPAPVKASELITSNPELLKVPHTSSATKKFPTHQPTEEGSILSQLQHIYRSSCFRASVSLR